MMEDTMEKKAPSIKKRGRPKKGEGKSIREWQPIWKPEYESIVAESCLGVANSVLAKNYNFTPEHVSNILNTEQARLVKRKCVEVIRERSLEIAKNQLSEIEIKAVKNIHDVLHNPTIMEHNPLAIFDRSLQALKGLGKLKDDSQPGSVTNINVQNNQLVINGEQKDSLAEGLEEIQRIAEVHGNVTGESIK